MPGQALGDCAGIALVPLSVDAQVERGFSAMDVAAQPRCVRPEVGHNLGSHRNPEDRARPRRSVTRLPVQLLLRALGGRGGPGHHVLRRAVPPRLSRPAPVREPRWSSSSATPASRRARPPLMPTARSATRRGGRQPLPGHEQRLPLVRSGRWWSCEPQRRERHGRGHGGGLRTDRRRLQRAGVHVDALRRHLLVLPITDPTGRGTSNRRQQAATPTRSVASRALTGRSPATSTVTTMTTSSGTHLDRVRIRSGGVGSGRPTSGRPGTPAPCRWVGPPRPSPGTSTAMVRDDVLWHGGSGPDTIWWGGGRTTFGTATSTVVAAGTTAPISGDFDGDGRDDLLWYGPGSDPDAVWWGTSSSQRPAGCSERNGPVRGGLVPAHGRRL